MADADRSQPEERPQDRAGQPFLRHPDELRERLHRDRPGEEVSEVDRSRLRTAVVEAQVADERLREAQLGVLRLLLELDVSSWQGQRFLGALPVAALLCDGQGRIVAANTAAARLLGVPAAELPGTAVLSFLTRRDRTAVLRLDGSDPQPFRRTVTLVRPGLPEAGLDVSAEPASGPDGGAAWLVVAAPSRWGGHTRLPQALVQLSGLAVVADGLDDLVQQAVVVCHDGLGPDVEVSLCWGPPTEPTAYASSGSAVQALDGAQVHHQSGPAPEAWTARTTVVTGHLSADPRWPGLTPPPSVQAVVATPVRDGDEVVGVVQAVRSTRDVDEWLPAACALVAEALGAVLQEFQVREDLRSLNADLERALASRSVIDQAKGIVMADRGLDPDGAFEHLVTLSNRHGIKVRVVAARIVAQAATRARR